MDLTWTSQPVCIARHILRQYFERNFAPELRIRRAVHFTHPARAYRGTDSVMGDGQTDQTSSP